MDVNVGMLDSNRPIIPLQQHLCLKRVLFLNCLPNLLLK